MLKDSISVALTKDLIKKLNEESRKDGRSRSNLIQFILERYFANSEDRSTTGIQGFRRTNNFPEKGESPGLYRKGYDMRFSA
jgi:predicted DNA-binding protein